MWRSNITAVTVGTGGITYPLWATWLTTGWSIALAVGGAVLLCLTIRNKILENRKLQRDLNAKK